MSNARASLGVRLPRDLLRQAASRVRSAPGRCCRTRGGGRGPGARGPGARAGLEVEKGEVGRGTKAKPGPEGISPASGGCARPGPRRPNVPSATCRSPYPSKSPGARSVALPPGPLFLLFRPPTHPAPPRFSRAARPRPWPRLPRPSRHLALLTGLSPLHSGRSPSSHSATLPSCGCPGLRPRA